MILDEVQGALERSGFATGFLVASLALVGAVLVIMAWPRSSRPAVLPVAGVLLAGSAALALAHHERLPGGLAAGLGALALGGMAAAAIDRLFRVPAAAGAVLALPGAWLVAGAAGLGESGPRILLVATITLGAGLAAAADHAYRPLGLGPLLVLASVAGAYATVPDTERAVIVLGAALPLAVLGWPWPLASLGRAGAFAAVGLLAWVAVTDGSARAGSTVGAMAGLGVLLIEPVVRVLPGAGTTPRPGTRAGDDAGDGLAAWRAAVPVMALHLALVAVASRVAGFRSDAEEAAVIAAVALGLSVLAARRWPALLTGTGLRHRG